MLVKYGVLDFRYNNRHFLSLKKEFERNGTVTVNVGDNIQAIATRMLYKEMGIQDNQVISINRDELPTYDGEPVVLVMNGYFYEDCFPIPNKIIPIFIGFAAPESVLKKNKMYFRKYEPIGCRDVDTATILKKLGINSYTTGCLSLTFSKRLESPQKPKTFIVHGKGSGELPKKLISHIPKDITKDAEFVLQRMPCNAFPLSQRDSYKAEQFAQNLLRRFKEEATLVITPLLHAACPCIALGIPVVLARKDCDARFSAVSKLLPVYTPGSFSEIDWAPGSIDIEDMKTHMKDLTKYLIKEIPRHYYHINALSSIYES